MASFPYIGRENRDSLISASLSLRDFTMSSGRNLQFSHAACTGSFSVLEFWILFFSVCFLCDKRQRSRDIHKLFVHKIGYPLDQHVENFTENSR